MTPHEDVARELAVHAKALRAMARDLVGADAAADLVQETALRALRSPPAEPRGLGAWLTTILRNLAGNHRRDSERRGRRERAVAPKEAAVEATAELVARRDLLRAATEAVWRLPEPYQSVIVWRYYESLTPKRIAARSGVPVATVKSQLQRGLAMLRAELDRRAGAGRWRPALLLATGFGHTTVPLGVLLTLTMTPTTKLLSSAAAIAVAAWFTIGWLGDEPPQVDGTVAAAAPAVAEFAQTVEPTADGAGREPAVVPEAERAIDLRHPFEFGLRCRVLDQDGLPIAGARLSLALGDGVLNEWPQPTSADGVAELRWRAKTPTVAVAVGLLYEGRAQVLRRLEAQAGEVADCQLLAETEGFHARIGDGGWSSARDCAACHTKESIPNVFSRRLRLRDGLHPESDLADLLLGAAADAATAVEEPPAAESERADVIAEEVTSDAAPAAAPATVTGTVRGADGLPVAKQTVVWSLEPDRPLGRTKTDADGRFLFAEVPPGVVEIRAGGRRAGLGRVSVQAFAGREVDCEVHLARGTVLRGRAVGAGGEALAFWRVEFATHDGRTIDVADVDRDGTWELPNLPEAPGSLLLWSSRGDRLPKACEPFAHPGSTPVVLDLDARGGAAGRLRVLPVLPAELDHAAVEVVAWQVDSGRGTAMPRDGEGVFTLGGLCAGFYRVVVIAPGCGPLDAGRHWIDGSATVDLGAVALPAPGRLRLQRLPAGLELYLQRADADVRAELLERLPRGGELVLPLGSWLALWGDPSAPQARELTVSGEGEAVLDFGDAGR